MASSETVDLATLSEPSFEHEDVRLAHDAASGMVAVVAVHSTVLGPAIGGLRIRAYDGIGHALADALRLSRTMTYKNALAGLDAGGGKAVLLDSGPAGARRTQLEAFGSLVNSLEGRYVTAEDIGTTTEDMDVLASVTDHVIGRSSATGGLGDPSPRRRARCSTRSSPPCGCATARRTCAASASASWASARSARRCNILTADSVAERLHAAGILYVPYYVANCGGMLQVALEHRGDDAETLEASLAEAGRRTAALLARAAADGRLPVDVARELAQERLAVGSTA